MGPYIDINSVRDRLVTFKFSWLVIAGELKHSTAV